MSDAELLTIHTDGAARGNPGPAAYAYTIDHEGQNVVEEADRMGQTTNNQAEYTALVRALEHAAQLGTHYRVVVHSDSELMVKQMNGEYKVKNAELRPLYEEALDLSEQFRGGVRFVHVRREKNKRADELCNEALDGKRHRSTVQRPLSNVQSHSTGTVTTVDNGPRTVDSGLHDEALACLKAAGVTSPETVWRQLTELLQRHLRFNP